MPLIPFTEVMARAMRLSGNTEERIPILAAYLPSIFHEEAEKKFSPLWALLMLMEDNFASIASVLDEIDKYFDIWRAPANETWNEADFVSWLGTWVALVPEQHWSVQKKRYVLSIAADLHKYRGTITGLRVLLALFFDIYVEIEEWAWPKGMQIDVINTIEVDTCIDDQFNINNCFTVTWKPKPEETGPGLKHKIARIRHMIDREKPANTFCYFNVVGFEE